MEVILYLATPKVRIIIIFRSSMDFSNPEAWEIIVMEEFNEEDIWGNIDAETSE